MGFFTNNNVTSINLGANVKILNNTLANAFNGCANLTTVSSIPNSVTNMAYAFYNCKKFNAPVSIPNGVTNMVSAFYNCTAFNQPVSISLKNRTASSPSTTAVLSSAFSNCNALNQPININAPNATCAYMFRNSRLLNQSIYINGPYSLVQAFMNCNGGFINPNINIAIHNVNNAYQIFWGANYINCPVTFTNVNTLAGAFSNANSANFHITLTNVNSLFRMLGNTTSPATIIFTDNSPTDVSYMFNLYSGGALKRRNIFVPAGGTLNTKLSATNASSSIFGNAVTWTQDSANNCYYNSARNTYIYYV